MNALSRMKYQSGFTLLEVLIALVILAVGIFGVASMQISSIQGNSKGRQISEATNVASALMENLISRNYDDACLLDRNGDGTDGTDGTNEDWSSRDFPDPDSTALCSTVPVSVPDGYNLFWNVAEDEPMTRTKTIRIFVEGPQIKTFALDMIKTDV